MLAAFALAASAACVGSSSGGPAGPTGPPLAELGLVRVNSITDEVGNPIPDGGIAGTVSVIVSVTFTPPITVSSNEPVVIVVCLSTRSDVVTGGCEAFATTTSGEPIDRNFFLFPRPTGGAYLIFAAYRGDASTIAPGPSRRDDIPADALLEWQVLEWSIRVD